MLVLTKKRHIEIRFIGPQDKKSEAISALKPLGFVDVSDSVPWMECFPELDEQSLPGVVLAGARAKEGLTQQRLSELTGIPQRHISEMENGRRPIGRDIAKRLERALKVGYKVFL
jgi:hypothetical protein